MKTLNEVIEALDLCSDSLCDNCSYNQYNGCNGYCEDEKNANAAYYLRIFRDYSIQQKKLSERLLDILQLSEDEDDKNS